MSTFPIIERYTEGPGCGMATGKDGCTLNGEHPSGSPMFILLRRSMITREWFQWDANVNDGDGYVMHADGSIDSDNDSLDSAAREAWRIASELPFKRGDFKRTGTFQLVSP